MKRKTNNDEYHLIYGFEKACPVNKGYVAINRSGQGQYGVYDIVENEVEAERFPHHNIKKIFDFISTEDELQDWKFHLVNRIKH